MWTSVMGTKFRLISRESIGFDEASTWAWILNRGSLHVEQRIERVAVVLKTSFLLLTCLIPANTDERVAVVLKTLFLLLTCLILANTE